MELRGECQESVYNLGRALHQLGLTHLAIHYYQKALTLPAQKLEVCSLSVYFLQIIPTVMFCSTQSLSLYNTIYKKKSIINLRNNRS